MPNSSMSLVSRSCVVCGRPSTSYHYGVDACNACKMFFRRIIFGTLPTVCREDMNCGKNSNVLSKCRYCRFQTCVQSGMVYKPSGNSIDGQQCDSMSALISHLGYLDNQRLKKFGMYFMDGDPTMDEVAGASSFRLFIKPSDKKMDQQDWWFMTSITTIDYMKKFDFFKQLDPEDQKMLLICTFFHYSLLANALKALQGKQAGMAFPDGTGLITVDKYPISKKLENRIRCLLVGRLAELNVTNEEFLLLNVVLFCNPALPCLSEKARSILSATQRTYSSTLLQYCLLNHQQSGPTRFTDLLSICHVINKTCEDISYHYTLFRFFEPDATHRRLFGP